MYRSGSSWTDAQVQVRPSLVRKNKYMPGTEAQVHVQVRPSLVKKLKHMYYTVQVRPSLYDAEEHVLYLGQSQPGTKDQIHAHVGA
jgi:hypothetical protein